MLVKLTMDDYNNINIDMIIKAYRLNDALCVSVVNSSALLLAIAMKNMFDLLDIDKAIIGGKIEQFGDSYLNIIKSFIKKASVLPEWIFHADPLITLRKVRKNRVYG
jgi:predicted NBD/HSP70 family sugar kinase